MSKKNENQSTINNSNQILNQKPLDIIMNEYFINSQTSGHNKNWFIPIITDQDLMDKVVKVKSVDEDMVKYYMNRIFPNILLECNRDEKGNVISLYVLYSKGGKLYKVISEKDYGIVKSRMILKNNLFIPYEKCKLEPFNGKLEEFENNKILKSFSYKNGVKNGECITYYGDTKRSYRTSQYFEKTTYINGKKNGEFLNTKFNITGNYINDNKCGEWRVLEKHLIKEIGTNYKKNYDLKTYDVEGFIKNQLPFYLYNHDYTYKVNYVNDILNGEFEIEDWKGEFKLGLINGQIKKDSSRDYITDVNTINYVNGLKDGFEIHYQFDNDGEEDSKLEIKNYEKGKIVSSTKFTTNKSSYIPNVLSTLTNKYLNEDVFNTLIDNNMNLEESTLEEFLNNWVVLDYKEFGDDKSIQYDISIKYNELKYTNDYYFDFNKYMVLECGYPYFKVENLNFKEHYFLEKSDEYSIVREYHPKIFSISEFEKTNKVLIGGNLIEEKIDDEINPEVLTYQKTQFQKLSKFMKLSYEDELLQNEIDRKNIQEEEQKEKEEQGLLINSFPVD
jgi:hypothetical protein